LATATDTNNEMEKQFRAFSASGLAFYYTYSREKNSKLATEQLDKLGALAGGLRPEQVQRVLRDRQMEQLVQKVLETNRLLSDESKKEWDSWLNELRSDEGDVQGGDLR
jgi:hypothetical protein